MTVLVNNGGITLGKPFAGKYGITGTVKKVTLPGRYLVRLLDRVTGRYLAQTYSDETTGVYEFNNYAIREYVIYSLDATKDYNAAIADRPPMVLS